MSARRLDAQVKGALFLFLTADDVDRDCWGPAAASGPSGLGAAYPVRVPQGVDRPARAHQEPPGVLPTNQAGVYALESTALQGKAGPRLLPLKGSDR
jgi:hypothetical protein